MRAPRRLLPAPQLLAILAALTGLAEMALPERIHDTFERPAAALLVAVACLGAFAWRRATAGEAQAGLHLRLRENTEEELRRSEERLQLAQLVARIGTWDTDLTTGVTTWSTSLRELCGITGPPGSEPEFQDLVHPDDRARVAREVRLAAESGGDFDFDYRLVQPGGAVRWMLSRGRVIKDGSGGGFIRRVGVAMDISERHEAEEERARLEHQLRQAQKLEAVGRLAGGVAHDFNNLLLGIRGYGELALRSLARGEDASEEVEEMVAGADRASVLTRQLLAFSRRQVLRSEVIDLVDVLGDMHKLLRRIIGEDVRLETIGASEPVHVNADRGQLEQVIANLAVNARDAMPDGGRLTLRVTKVDVGADGLGLPPGEFALLSVSDTGCGMDAETAAQIFDPFFTTKRDGTGLGLATVHGIVTQSGGSIWVYSEPGEGTTFKVYLPLAATANAPALAPSQPVPAGLAGETILLVEDDDQVRAVVLRMLESLGYRVLSAGDGDAALDLAASCDVPIDLLLSDLIMPGLGGREVAERLRPLHPEAAVLYMSGYSDEAVIRRGILDRKAAFIEKPFASGDLARRVREALDARSQSAIA